MRSRGRCWERSLPCTTGSSGRTARLGRCKRSQARVCSWLRSWIPIRCLPGTTPTDERGQTYSLPSRKLQASPVAPQSLDPKRSTELQDAAPSSWTHASTARACGVRKVGSCCDVVLVNESAEAIATFDGCLGRGDRVHVLCSRCWWRQA